MNNDIETRREGGSEEKLLGSWYYKVQIKYNSYAFKSGFIFQVSPRSFHLQVGKSNNEIMVKNKL